MLLKTTLILTMLGGAMIALSRGTATPAADDAPQQAIAATLDAFHAAASKADFNAYFALFAPDGVFLGTDASERWPVEEFKQYAKPLFDSGKGWTYVPVAGRRFISVADDGRTAWFDELLDNAKYGTCRGSGALRKTGDEWRIAQYNLSFMIPNEVAKDVVALVRSKVKTGE